MRDGLPCRAPHGVASEPDRCSFWGIHGGFWGVDGRATAFTGTVHSTSPRNSSKVLEAGLAEVHGHALGPIPVLARQRGSLVRLTHPWRQPAPLKPGVGRVHRSLHSTRSAGPAPNWPLPRVSPAREKGPHQPCKTAGAAAAVTSSWILCRWEGLCPNSLDQSDALRLLGTGARQDHGIHPGSDA